MFRNCILAILLSVATATHAAPKKNVIFIICDDLNDNIHGMGGHPQAYTPNIDRLAKMGVQFTNAHSNCPMCAPSRPSLLSGLLPSTSGKYHGQTKFRQLKTMAHAKLFPEHFRDNGYAVYCTGKLFHGPDQDMTIFGTTDPRTQPKTASSYEGGYMGPHHSFGPYPWDGKTLLWRRPSRTNAYGKEGVHWKLVKAKVTPVKGGGRWNCNPKLPVEIREWDYGFGRLSRPPLFIGDGNGLPRGYRYKGWAYCDKGQIGADGKEGGVFRYNGPDDRAPMPDEIQAKWVCDLLDGKSPTSYVGGRAAPIAGRPFMITCGFVKTHVANYLPDEFFDAVLKHNRIKDANGIELPPLKDGRLENDDLDDIPESIRRYGAGHKRFIQMMKAGKNYPGGAEKLFKDYILAYLASVYEIDVQVGKILDALDRHPQVRSNTVIILTSDHGWHNGEKQKFFKYTLWEEATRVPFIVADLSTAFDAGRGEKCDHPVSLVDIYATLVDLCDLPQPRHGPGTPKSDSHSVAPFLRDPANGTWDGPDVAVSAVRGNAKADPRDPNQQHFSVRSRRWRYTLTADGGEELYDHQNDPNEWTNQANNPEFAAIKAKLRAELCRLTGRRNE